MDDTDVATSVSGYSDYQLWSVYYGGEGEMQESSEEGLEGLEEWEEEQEDADVMTQYQDKGDGEKKEKSRELVGVILFR